MSSSLHHYLFHSSFKEECTRSIGDPAPAVSITSDTYYSDVAFSPFAELRSLFVGSHTNTEQTGRGMQNCQSPGGGPPDAEPTSPQVGCMGQVKNPSVFHRTAAKPPKPRPSAERDGKDGPLVNFKTMFPGMWPWKKSTENGKTTRKKYRRQATADKFDSKQTEDSPAASVMTDQPVPSSGRRVLESKDSSLWKRRFGNRTLKNIEVQTPSPLSFTKTEPWSV